MRVPTAFHLVSKDLIGVDLIIIKSADNGSAVEPEKLWFLVVNKTENLCPFSAVEVLCAEDSC